MTNGIENYGVSWNKPRDVVVEKPHHSGDKIWAEEAATLRPGGWNHILPFEGRGKRRKWKKKQWREKRGHSTDGERLEAQC